MEKVLATLTFDLKLLSRTDLTGWRKLMRTLLFIPNPLFNVGFGLFYAKTIKYKQG